MDIIITVNGDIEDWKIEVHIAMKASPILVIPSQGKLRQLFFAGGSGSPATCSFCVCASSLHFCSKIMLHL